MSTTVERPTPPRPPRRYRHSDFSSAQPPVSTPPIVTSEPAQPHRKPAWWERYRSHLIVGGVSIIATAIALSPLILGSTSRSSLSSAQAPVRSVAVAPQNLSTNVTISASEFKFGPNTINVPVGQKVSFTLNNTGVVEHDFTVQGVNFSLTAKPGGSATGEYTFDKPGVFDFFCSIPGHKDAGMKGTLNVVDPSAAQPVVAASSSMADMPGMSVASTASAPDIQPLPANLKPLPQPEMAPPTDRTEPAYVKLNLTTEKVTAQLADGVAYDYWTFNGTVPGPMLRVREGDTVEIDLHNAADAGVTHSIDLHAVTGPGGGAKVMQIAPGEDGAFRFQALNPGVYVYHCATPMVAQHIASGMYGMIVVEPKAGLPKVDHEYYLMQGDFYLQGQRGDTGLRAFDLNKMLDERPDYVLFNGGVGSLTGDNALQAKVGDTIRIFFGDGGPNLTSSLHVIGAIFDRVYPEGSLTSTPETNVQTTHVSTGGATMVEFKAQVPGTYSIVDHSLGRMEKGAAGQIVVTGPSNPEIFEPLSSGTASAPTANAD